MLKMVPEGGEEEIGDYRCNEPEPLMAVTDPRPATPRQKNDENPNGLVHGAALWKDDGGRAPTNVDETRQNAHRPRGLKGAVVELAA